MAGRDLINLYELDNLSSCRRGTLHRHDLEQLPLLQGSPNENPPEKVHTRLHPKEGLIDESSTAPGSLQLDIMLRIHERICKSFPSLTPSLT